VRSLFRVASVALVAAFLALAGGSSAQAVTAPNGTVNAGVSSTMGYSNVLVSFQSTVDGLVWQGYIPRGHRWGEGTNSSYTSEPQNAWANANHVLMYKVNSNAWVCLPGGTSGKSYGIHPGAGFSGTWAVTLGLQQSPGGKCY
jgi:hypothetical protein